MPVVQLLCLMITPYLGFCWSAETNAKYLACVMSFAPNSLTDEFDIIPSCVMCAILLIEMIIVVVIPAAYKQKRYSKVVVSLEAVLTQVLLPFLMIPFSVHITYLLDSLSTSVNVGDVLLVVFFIAVLVMACFMVSFMAKMNCFLLLPNKSPIATYEGKHPALLLIGACVYIVVSSLCALFEKWLLIVIMVLHMAFLGYMVYDVFQFPFVCQNTHAFACALYRSCADVRSIRSVHYYIFDYDMRVQVDGFESVRASGGQSVSD